MNCARKVFPPDSIIAIAAIEHDLRPLSRPGALFKRIGNLLRGHGLAGRRGYGV